MNARIRTGQVFVAAVLLAVAGCAPAVQWVKPETSQAQAAADERQCDSIADNEVSLEMSSSHPLYPPWTETLYVATGSATTGGHGPAPSYSREGPRKYELAGYCMQQRGYKLLPKETKGTG